MNQISRAAICILALRVASCAPELALAQYIPTRPPRLARTLPGHHVARVVTNAPVSARISVPLAGLRAWSAGLRVLPGDVVSREGSIYVCVQGHLSQADWTPAVTPALWRLVRSPSDGAIPAWRQPLGAHDAYALGARVLHEGHTWESTINANVWAPGVYGWKRVD